MLQMYSFSSLYDLTLMHSQKRLHYVYTPLNRCLDSRHHENRVRSLIDYKALTSLIRYITEQVTQ